MKKTLRYGEAFLAKGAANNLFKEFTQGQRERLATLLKTGRENWTDDDTEFVEEFFGSVVDGARIVFVQAS